MRLFISSAYRPPCWRQTQPTFCLRTRAYICDLQFFTSVALNACTFSIPYTKLYLSSPSLISAAAVKFCLSFLSLVTFSPPLFGLPPKSALLPLFLQSCGSHHLSQTSVLDRLSSSTFHHFDPPSVISIDKYNIVMAKWTMFKYKKSWMGSPTLFCLFFLFISYSRSKHRLRVRHCNTGSTSSLLLLQSTAVKEESLFLKKMMVRSLLKAFQENFYPASLPQSKWGKNKRNQPCFVF